MCKSMEKGEIVEESSECWETYIVRVMTVGNFSYGIIIPRDIVRYLHLRKGDTIQVAIKRRDDVPPIPESVRLKLLAGPPKHHEWSRIKQVLEEFLSSNQPYAELRFNLRSVYNFLARNPGYKDKIKVHVTGYGKPDSKVWVERLDLKESRDG